MDAKMEYAVKLYNKGDYFKALPLLEELITVYRGTQKSRTYLLLLRVHELPAWGLYVGRV